MFTFFDPNCDFNSGRDPPEVDSSCKGLAHGAGCDEARPRDETWIQESLLTKVVDKVGQWILPFPLCLLWHDIDVVAGGLSPCFQPASAGQQAVAGRICKRGSNQAAHHAEPDQPRTGLNNQQDKCQYTKGQISVLKRIKRLDKMWTYKDKEQD